MQETIKAKLKDVNLCSFSDDNMSISQHRLNDSALNMGIELNNIFSYLKRRDNWFGFNQPFIEKNKSILNEQRGCGYWLWKPYVIWNTLLKIEENDWLLYLDAGTEIIGDVSYLKEQGQDFVLFNNVWSHMDWCKMDTIKAMIHFFNDRDLKQIQASAMMIKNTQKNRDIVYDWVAWCCDKHLIDDSPSVEPNVDTFREHRHDQAILTNLSIAFKIPTISWDLHITYDKNNQERKHPDIPILFYHHRKRNNEW
jgi:hypothetical protein